MQAVSKSVKKKLFEYESMNNKELTFNSQVTNTKCKSFSNIKEFILSKREYNLDKFGTMLFAADGFWGISDDEENTPIIVDNINNSNCTIDEIKEMIKKYSNKGLELVGFCICHNKFIILGGYDPVKWCSSDIINDIENDDTNLAIDNDGCIDAFDLIKKYRNTSNFNEETNDGLFNLLSQLAIYNHAIRCCRVETPSDYQLDDIISEFKSHNIDFYDFRKLLCYHKYVWTNKINGKYSTKGKAYMYNLDAETSFPADYNQIADFMMILVTK